MALTLTILGCSGTYASAGGACSGYLVRSDTTSLWLDTGPGTLGNLQRHVSLGDVDAVVVSHSHPDHWLELPVLCNALKYGIGMGDRRLPVYGTAETEQALSTLIGPLGPTFDWHTISAGSLVDVGDLALTFSCTDHPVETLAVRVDHGSRALGYSADTGPGWSLSELSRIGAGGPVHLALCEASLDTSQERQVQHLSARQAGIAARSADVGRLLLTHLVPGRDPHDALADAAATFAGPIDVASLGTTYEV